jgi:hypothetical protein
MIRAILVLLVLASSASARTWYVRPDGLGDASTIQAAVDSAAAGDTLLLADGVYRGDGNRDVSVGKWLMIQSESDDPEACIIDCEGSSASPHRALSIAYLGGGDDPEVSGLSVVNGWHYEGGAIWVDPPGVDIRNCVFSGNYAGRGGGVFIAESGSPSVISECVFSGNDGNRGSAVYAIYHHSYVIIEHCLFTNNNSEWCTVGVEDEELGWILVELNNCTFVGNSGYYSAVHSRAAEPDCCRLNNCIISFGTGEPWPGGECLVYCTAFYGNQHYPDGPSTYGPATWDNGNFMGCPSFCDRLGDPPDLHICSGSPCAPGNHPYGFDCGLIGALGVGCTCGPSTTESTTLGGIKSSFRE